MRAVDIIEKKKQGRELVPEEIAFLVEGYVQGEIPDYQVAAWLMAVCLRGMGSVETAALTQSLVHSGEVLDLSSIPGVKVDKHSTGGVGDKTTLVLAPLLASAGLTVVKMSGRSLGFTGGTIDKLEAIPGIRTRMSWEEVVAQARRVGVVVVGQSENLVPADKKLYALRDATATVDSVPLIAASVMSKKIAAGAGAMVLDVKVGDGAFMRTEAEAQELAKVMVHLGREAGRQVAVLLTSMDEPLGTAVGNALEVAEAVETLQGRGPDDLRALCLELGATLLGLTGRAVSLDEGRGVLAGLLDSGAAWDKYREWVGAQGGDPDPAALPAAPVRQPFPAPATGYVREIRSRLVGQAAGLLGAGRGRLDEVPDPAAGIVLAVKRGDRVEEGQPLGYLHTRRLKTLPEATEMVRCAFAIGPTAPEPQALVRGRVGADASGEGFGAG
ncbi:MAG: thymidine phosphorylase [Clostridia bacterium]|nr:MAG: thymidine phosphorylase [Clostridia bacterium]